MNCSPCFMKQIMLSYKCCVVHVINWDPSITLSDDWSFFCNCSKCGSILNHSRSPSKFVCWLAHGSVKSITISKCIICTSRQQQSKTFFITSSGKIVSESQPKISPVKLLNWILSLYSDGEKSCSADCKWEFP